MVLGDDILGLWAMSTPVLKNLHGSLCLQKRGQPSQPGRAFHQLASVPFTKRLSPVSLPVLHLKGLVFHVWSLKSFHLSSPSSNVIFSMKLLQNPQNDSSSSSTITECLDWSFCVCPGLGWPPSDCGQLKHTDCCSKSLGFSHLSVHQNHLGGFVKISIQAAGSNMQNFGFSRSSVGPGSLHF